MCVCLFVMPIKLFGYENYGLEKGKYRMKKIKEQRKKMRGVKT